MIIFTPFQWIKCAPCFWKNIAIVALGPNSSLVKLCPLNLLEPLAHLWLSQELQQNIQTNLQVMWDQMYTHHDITLWGTIFKAWVWHYWRCHLVLWKWPYCDENIELVGSSSWAALFTLTGLTLFSNRTKCCPAWP